MAGMVRCATNADDLQARKKKLLPVALFNGTFSYKSQDRLKQYGNFTVLDFDHFENESELQSIGRRLVVTPCVYAVFRSPSGRGLKALVMHDNIDPNHHRELYEQLLMKFATHYTDASGIDLARGTYLCYDPYIWVNGKCQPYNFLHDPNYVTKVIRNGGGTYSPCKLDIDQLRAQQMVKVVQKTKSDKSVIAILNSKWRKDDNRWTQGNRANSVFNIASELCLCGVDIDLTLEYMHKAYIPTSLSHNEIVYQTLRGYQNNMNSYGVNRKKIDR